MCIRDRVDTVRCTDSYLLTFSLVLSSIIKSSLILSCMVTCNVVLTCGLCINTLNCKQQAASKYIGFYITEFAVPQALERVHIGNHLILHACSCACTFETTKSIVQLRPI